MVEYSSFARHVAVDVWGVDFDKLNNIYFLETIMANAAENVGTTILSIQSEQFHPQGATILFLLSESHLSIHTYPENRFAALDCYTCDETIDPQSIIDDIVYALHPETVYKKKLIRGDGEIKEF